MSPTGAEALADIHGLLKLFLRDVDGKVELPCLRLILCMYIYVHASETARWFPGLEKKQEEELLQAPEHRFPCILWKRP